MIGYDDGVTSGTYEYDDAYQKVLESVDYGSFVKTNTYTYLKNGLKETFTGPDSIPYGYLYDANNQLTGVQIPNVGYVTISEYTWNRPASMTLPGGSTKTFEYDPLMRIKKMIARDPGQNELLNYQYTYDRMDNITVKDTEHGNYDYGYDDLYRLIAADNPVQEDETFTYDGVGNRLTSADTTGNWTYNQNNELGGYDDVTYEYDANGNTTNQTDGTNSTSFVYNIEDRLTQVWDGEVGTGTLTASYYYDPFGRRLWKDVGGTRTYFHYADEGLIGEYDSAGNEIKTYGYKPGSTWTTDPLFMKVGTEYYLYQNDHLGTPQKMTTVSGAMVWSAKYSSFGEATVEVETVINNLRFPGQYEDAETGLHYNMWRYYEPGTGRYLKVDPVGLDGGINLYLYVENDPLRLIDPEGLFVPRRHNRITLAAVEKECPKLKDKLPQLTAAADFIEGTQDVENSYQHSMTDWKHKQSAVDARKQRNKWVDDLLSQCDIGSLARALHAIEDEYSEAHNFKPWKGGTPGPMHLWKDSWGALGTPSRNAELAAIALIKKFKEKCPCICNEQN